MMSATSLLAFMSIPFFLSGVSFQKICWPLRLLQVAFFISHTVYICRRLRSKFQDGLWSLEALTYTVFLTCCFSTNVTLIFRCKKIGELLSIHWSSIKISSQRFLIVKTFVLSLVCLLVIAGKITETDFYFPRRHYSLAHHSYLCFEEALVCSFIYTGSFVYISFFDLMFMTVLQILSQLQNKPSKSLKTVIARIDYCLDLLEDCDRTINLIPFLALTSIFFKTSNTAVSFDQKGRLGFSQSFIRPLYLSTSAIEAAVVIALVFWTERQMRQINRLVIRTLRLIKLVEDNENSIDKLTVIHSLENLSKFSPTAASVVRLDRSLLLSFASSVLTFTVMFRSLGETAPKIHP